MQLRSDDITYSSPYFNLAQLDHISEDKCVLIGYYSANSGKLLPTF